MKDKNGKEILAGSKCIVNGAKLGMVTMTGATNCAVLVLSDDVQECSERLISDSEAIEIKG